MYNFHFFKAVDLGGGKNCFLGVFIYLYFHVFTCIYLFTNVVHGGDMTEEQVSCKKSFGSFPLFGTIIILFL
jgi:hypothetical protein